MRPLYESIERAASNKGQAASIKKHLAAVGIEDWDGLTKSGLYELRDHLTETVAPNTAKTVLASLKAILRRYEDDVELPKGWDGILQAKGEKPLKTYLTVGELGRLEKTIPHGRIERIVLNQFLVSAWTGMRISDARDVCSEKIREGVLTYVSKKTKTTATVPLRPGIAERIEWLQENGEEIYLATYNDAIRRLAKRAGIRSTVVVFKGGEEKRGEKWEFITSHTARVSFCTNLAKTGTDLLVISRLAGHSSVQMTQRYCVPTGVELNAKAKTFFGIN